MTCLANLPPTWVTWVSHIFLYASRIFYLVRQQISNSGQVSLCIYTCKTMITQWMVMRWTQKATSVVSYKQAKVALFVIFRITLLFFSNFFFNVESPILTSIPNPSNFRWIILIYITDKHEEKWHITSHFSIKNKIIKSFDLAPDEHMSQLFKIKKA